MQVQGGKSWYFASACKLLASSNMIHYNLETSGRFGSEIKENAIGSTYRAMNIFELSVVPLKFYKTKSSAKEPLLLDSYLGGSN